MKKIFKISLITLLSVVGLLIITVTILIWIVFTPSKITPIVNSQLKKYIKCEAKFDNVELTFFSTFPQFGLHASNFLLANIIETSPSDTLLYVNGLTAKIDAKAFFYNNEIIINGIELNNGKINAFVDKNGNSNYDIIKEDTEDKDTSSFDFSQIDISYVDISKLDIKYIDEQSGLYTNVQNINTKLKGNYKPEKSFADLNLNANKIDFEIKDSTSIQATVLNPIFQISGDYIDKNIELKAEITSTNLTFLMDSVSYVNNVEGKINFPLLKYNLDSQKLILDKSEISINKQQFFILGDLSIQDSTGWVIDFDVETNKSLEIKKILALVPEVFSEYFKEIKLDGSAKLGANVKGIYNDSLMPIINSTIELSDGKFSYSDLPYKLSNIKGVASIFLDLNNIEKSELNIHNISLKTLNTSANVAGNIADFTGNMLLNLKINANLALEDILPIMPESMNLKMSGKAENINLSLISSLDNLINVDFNKIKVNASANLVDANIIYEDSTVIITPTADIKILTASNEKNKIFKEIMQIDIKANTLHAEMIDLFKANVNQCNMLLGFSDFMDNNSSLSISTDFNISDINFVMDTINANIYNPKGNFMMTPNKLNSTLTSYIFDLTSKSLNAKLGNDIFAVSETFIFKGDLTYDSIPTNVLKQWNPNVEVNMQKGMINTSLVDIPINIPSLKFKFADGNVNINEARLILDSSSFKLKGHVYNIFNLFDLNTLLEADLYFDSENTNINQLMDVISGFGATDSTQKAVLVEPIETGNSEPFMVPWKMNVTFRTQVKKALIGKTILENVGGTLVIKDGVMILEQMGFTCDAAKMQLTAMYRSQRKNHLFAGIDFHLIDIDIDKLINMFPDIDTMIPMLSSLKGSANFHLAGESYMKSNYDLKWSTVRGAVAIDGKNLVLLDSEIFNSISKKLLFSKKTENIIDSMSVEMTLFKKEIDIYPFILSMDKYQVITSGRYNLDNKYDAHLETLRPVRLALNVNGKNSDMKYKLTKTKYSDLYKPEKQNAAQKQTMELKKIISDALKANVKSHPALEGFEIDE